MYLRFKRTKDNLNNYDILNIEEYLVKNKILTTMKESINLLKNTKSKDI